MRIMINGRWSEQQGPLSVACLLERLSLQPHRVAVERNKEIVRRQDFARTALAESDALEIVTLVGGG